MVTAIAHRLERVPALAESRALRIAGICLCMVMPIILSHFFIGQSLRLDEAQSLWQTSRSLPDIFRTVAGDVHVPLYHVLLHYWRLGVGSGVEASRLLSLLFLVLSVPMLFKLGELAYDTRTAFFATLLFVLSPFMNWYGNEVRMYTLFVFFTLANQYFFLLIFRRGRDGRGNVRSGAYAWSGYAATAVIGSFAHYFFLLNFAAQIMFYVLYWERFPRHALKQFILVAIVVLAALGPWAWYVLHVGTIGFEMPALTRPTTVTLFSAFSQFLLGYQSNGINAAMLSLWPIAVLLGFLAIGRRVRLSAETGFFIIGVTVPFAVAFGASLLVTPVFESRYLIFTVPSVYLVIASLFWSYAPWLSRLARYSLVALMLVTLAVEITSPLTPVKEDYAAAVGFINAHATAQDAVLLSAPFTIYPVQYYYHSPAMLSTLPVWNQYASGPIPAFSEEALPAEVASTTASDQNAYLLLSYNQGYEQDIKRYFDLHYQRLYAHTYSHDLSLYVYRLRYNTNQTAIATSLP